METSIIPIHALDCTLNGPFELLTGPSLRSITEQELLQVLCKYEYLLRQNIIKFEPLYEDPPEEKESLNADSSCDSDDEQPQSYCPHLHHDHHTRDDSSGNAGGAPSGHIPSSNDVNCSSRLR